MRVRGKVPERCPEGHPDRDADKGDVREARPGPHVGEVRDPESVGDRRPEVAVHEVCGPGRVLVRHGRAPDLPTHHA